MIISQVKKGIKTLLPGHFPDFMIIGAQKSGTTSLHDYLNQHPNLTGSSPKEIHYFDRKIHQGLSLDWYKKHFYRKSLKSQWYYETTPEYIYVEDVPKQISVIKPDMKFILILREPVERAYSAWNMYWDFFKKNEVNRIKTDRISGKESSLFKKLYKNKYEFPSFLEVVKLEESLIKKNLKESPSIIRRGFYAKQIKNYLNFFDKSQILILGFKELTNDASSCLEKIYKFLEIDYYSLEKINKKPRNNRKYDKILTDEERDYVKSIYDKSNEELFDLLGFKPNW